MKKVLLTVALLSSSLLAEVDYIKDGSIGGKLSTLGLGVEYGIKYSNSFGARLGINGFDYDETSSKSGINYDIDLKLRTISAIADYHPFESGFRISTGIIYNENKASFAANPAAGAYNINNVVYNASDVGSLHGDVDFNDFAPYVGIGYSSNNNQKGWSFIGELGAMYQGDPNTRLNVICGSGLTQAQCSSLRSDVLAEQRELDNDIDDFKWYPVVSIGFRYKF